MRLQSVGTLEYAHPSFVGYFYIPFYNTFRDVGFITQVLRQLFFYR